MNVYFVSGLAADRRVFKNIRLPAHCAAIFLDWIEPLKKETLPAYALRLAERIDQRAPFALIGLSMGGMITTEIARQYNPAITILISSVPSAGELPFYMKAAGKLYLHRLVPVSVVKSASAYKRLFSRETAEDKEVLRAIIRDSDSKFIYWAMHAILRWRGNAPSSSYVHIHGSHDAILPIRFTRPTHTILHGGHLMVMNRASEINAILQTVLKPPGA